ncbi:isoprenyl transferase [Corynebacterium incognita]|uniref:Isoprenyl transferase n=1 Tax=Corynebacterium incognita TaxID=2754725 RepID=A0A7G7CSA1_9CORY|nr:isoprenyl transferase [Corynebacterium incognita]
MPHNNSASVQDSAAAAVSAEPGITPEAGRVLTPPEIPAEFLPKHIAIVMDGNGRWAQNRGLKRTEGHKRGEAVLLDVVDACLAMGIPYLSAYAFSTENWRRSPEEVRFLMGFNRDVLRRQREWLNERGVRVVWVGRRPRLWRAVIKELEAAEELTKNNTTMTLAMCVNYGGRAEITDGVKAIAKKIERGELKPSHITEDLITSHMYDPTMPDVDLFLRPSGEKRTSNFMLWQSAYAEMVYQDKLFPDYTPQDLFDAVEEYAKRDRRFGGVKK